MTFPQLGSRCTVLFDADGHELWRHEDRGAPMRRAIPMDPRLAPRVHAQIALFFRPIAVSTPLGESDDDEQKQSASPGDAAEEGDDDAEDESNDEHDPHDHDPPTSPSPPPVDTVTT